MVYVNSRGQVVQQKEWSIRSPINFILGVWCALKLFFITMFGGSTDQANGPLFRGSSGTSGGGGGGSGWGGSGGGGRGSGSGGARPRFGTLGSSGGFKSPPPGSCPGGSCSGGSCG